MCSCDGFSRGSVAGRPALHAPGACGLVAVVLAAAIELKGTQERVTSWESTQMNTVNIRCLQYRDVVKTKWPEHIYIFGTTCQVCCAIKQVRGAASNRVMMRRRE